MSATTPLTASSVQQLEHTEADYFRRFLAGASDAARAELGISTTLVGGGAATAMRSDPSGYWSKAIGLGFDVAIDSAVVAEVIGFFRAAGRDSGLIALAPSALPDDWSDICQEHGLTQGWAQSKLSCPVTDFVAGTTDLVVRQLQADDVHQWERIIQEAFGMTDPDLTPMLAGTIEDPEARVFGAWDGDELVGAGAVHFVGQAASINTGGTLPTHRGRGVQSALVAARATAAAVAGCRVLVAETAADPAGTSFRNLVRSGFTHHYDRMNWHWGQ
jgi:GNAT superfamily N-acetyltransferase